MQNNIANIVSILRDEDNFLVTAHENPDGDALGSMAALCWVLDALGKNVVAYNTSGIPGYLDWLEFPCRFITSLGDLEDFTPSRVVVLDSGDANRTGTEMTEYLQTATSLNIDHHLGNPMFGTDNWVDTDCAAVGEMIAILANQLDIPLSGPLGEAVYLAMMTDTGHFSYGNTTPRVMEIAAEVLRRGLDLGAFTARYETNWSLNRMRLWGRLFERVNIVHDGQTAYMTLPNSLFEATGTALEDTEGIVNYLRRLVGVKVALTVREAEGGKSKISMRSHGLVNVQEVAASFGGGGHKNAAGATISKPIDAAVEAVLNALGEKLSQ